MTARVLSYDRPAVAWEEALPLGDGRLGVMVLGEPGRERYLLNDATAWSGSPHSAWLPPLITAEDAHERLGAARSAVLAGDRAGADRVVRDLQHRHSQAFLPLGEVVIETDRANGAGYRRRLDLDSGIHRVEADGVASASFVSWEHGVLVIELTGDRPFDVSVRLTSPLAIVSASAESLTLRFPSDVVPPHDATEDPVRYGGSSLGGAIVARLDHDGHAAGELVARGSGSARILIAAATTFDGLAQPLRTDPAIAHERAVTRLHAAASLAPQVLRRDHEAAFAAALGSTTLDSGGEPGLTTDARVAAADLDADPGLVGLLFAVSRYLLVTSSRVLPTTLQGIWNDSLQPPWSSNYTINLNVQLAYWAAEVVGLGDTVSPVFDLLDLLSETGTDTAWRYHGARGWASHHNSDIWGYSRPVGGGTHDPRWSYWPLGGVWLMRQYRDSDAFHPGDDLIRRAWDPARSAAEFCLDWLVELPDGSLGTAPSTSPESAFLENGVEVATAVSSAVDRWLIADHLRWLVEIAGRLGIDDDPVVRDAARAAARLPGPLAGPGGILEWLDDLPEADPQHRHLSHLAFAYPGDEVLDAELATAVERSLDRRGDDGPGWSIGWKAALRARLRDGAGVGRLLRLLFRPADAARGPWSGGMYPTLLVAHPPFQLDGNLAFLAAIAETLLQSHAGVIDLLPALPPELPDGRVIGLVARPGIEVSIEWRHGILVRSTLRARNDGAAGEHDVRYRGRSARVWVGVDRELVLDARLTAAAR